MPERRLLIFDADGTLRRSTVAGQPCPNRDGEWELIPGVRERLHRVDWTDVAMGVASNQAGVALGYLTAVEARHLLFDMLRAIGPLPRYPDMRRVHVELCPHAPAAGCQCRKPEPGMILRVVAERNERDYQPRGAEPLLPHPDPVRLDEVLYVGDMESDRLAAERAGVEFQWARDFFGWPP